MKKFYVLFLMCVWNFSGAQLPNPGFEETFGYGLEIANWGQFYVLPVQYNPDTDEFVSDEITFGDATLGGFTCTSSAPHAGQNAMLVRNALNVTKNEVIPGRANLFNNEISQLPTGWNTGIPVAPGAEIEFFGFWYKFAPLGDDIAEAKLELFDAGGQSVAKAVIALSGNNEQFAYVYTPLLFTSAEPAAFMTIEFSMAQEGSTPVFGSTLTIDDVVLNTAMLHNNTQPSSVFTVYPTDDGSQMNIVKNASAQDAVFDVSIIDMTGKTVKKQTMEITATPATLDISPLAKGVYVLKAESGKILTSVKFVKN